MLSWAAHSEPTRCRLGPTVGLASESDVRGHRVAAILKKCQEVRVLAKTATTAWPSWRVAQLLAAEKPHLSISDVLTSGTVEEARQKQISLRLIWPAAACCPSPSVGQGMR